LRPKLNGGDGGDDTPWDEPVALPSGGNALVVVIVGVAVLPVVAAGYLLYQLFKGALDIVWRDFPSPSVEDFIEVTEQPGTPGFLTVTLVTDPAMISWKDVEIYDSTGAWRGAAWTSDQKHSDTITVPNSALENGFLVLKKAKAFGIHTSMYVIHDDNPVALEQLRKKGGLHLTLNWRADDQGAVVKIS
jgi:hypothetical protein